MIDHVSNGEQSIMAMLEEKLITSLFSEGAANPKPKS